MYATEDSLVVGWGNALRGDDGVGCQVVERLEAEAPAGVRFEVLHQAGPELAAEMAHVARVVFVDASVDVDAVTVRKVLPADRDDDGGLGHAISPETLSRLTRLLYAAEPDVWAVHIPVKQFEFGCGLSAETLALSDQALRVVRDLATGSSTMGHLVCESQNEK